MVYHGAAPARGAAVSLPLVAIVGRPNVGKSTLFNRLVGRRRSIVTDEPGVTRDRLYGVVQDAPRPFRAVDTGGLVPGAPQPLLAAVERQAARALQEADAVLLVVDARAGLTPLDLEIAGQLRPLAVPVLVVANKVDTASLEPSIHEFQALGLGEPLPVSAEHGRGVQELLEALEAVLPASARTEATEDEGLRVAVVGRPNVGKSSLVNKLAGDERVLVSERPGTTRDAVDVILRKADRTFVLVDTAGLRRPGRVGRGVEGLAVQMAERSVARADIVVLVLDATQGFVSQDAHIAGRASEARRPVVVVVNKWDLVSEREQAAAQWRRTIAARLRWLKEPPLLFVSARTGQRVERILECAAQLHTQACRRVPTAELNRWLRDLHGGDWTSPARARDLRLLYVTQVGVAPPRFVFFCNDPRRVRVSVRRFLENQLRERFKFGPVPLVLSFRARRRS